MIDLMKRSSTSLIVFGALATIFGIVAAFFPVATALTLVVLWGIYALIDGVAAAFLAFSVERRQSRGLLIFTAVVGIAAGLFAVLQPFKSAVALAWIIGLWLIVRGVMELIGAFTNTDAQSRWLLALGGALWVLAGVLVISFPGMAALAISLWLGVLAIIWGIALLVAGFHVRKVSKETAPGAP
ncbi:MAG: HdeD family acid-resistance protein [Micropruina sp.]|nr:HdeD family acid-resistance protein [Micropruina sp.]